MVIDMGYPPVRVAKPGAFVFVGGVLSIQGWTFDMQGRYTPPGVNPFELWMSDITIAAWSYLNEHIEKAMGFTVIRASEEPIDLVSMDVELLAQQEAADLIGRARRA
jgi:hypothetical protein